MNGLIGLAMMRRAALAAGGGLPTGSSSLGGSGDLFGGVYPGAPSTLRPTAGQGRAAPLDQINYDDGSLPPPDGTSPFQTVSNANTNFGASRGGDVAGGSGLGGGYGLGYSFGMPIGSVNSRGSIFEGFSGGLPVFAAQSTSGRYGASYAGSSNAPAGPTGNYGVFNIGNLGGLLGGRGSAGGGNKYPVIVASH